MKKRPILFSGPMVRAILEGRKTQTRRVAKVFDIHRKMKGAPVQWAGAVHPARESGFVSWYPGNHQGLPEFTQKQYAKGFECPYGKPGDRLWVRETWQVRDETSYYTKADNKRHHTTHPGCAEVWEKTQPPEACPAWRSPLFMPRWASRITLEITGVRVERLQDISEADARAEGIRYHEASKTYGEGLCFGTATAAFQHLWDRINGKAHPWQSNPWCWVVAFRLINPSPQSETGAE